MCVFDHSWPKCKISVDHCCLEYSNDSNIRIKVSESLDSDSDSVQLQMSNKIRIRIRKKFFDEYYSDSDSPEKKDSFQHCFLHYYSLIFVFILTTTRATSWTVKLRVCSIQLSWVIIVKYKDIFEPRRYQVCLSSVLSTRTPHPPPL